MRFRILLFAEHRDMLGRDAAEIDVATASEDATATLADLADALARAHPELAARLPSAMWAVNHAFANDRTVVTASDEIALIPPVGGG